MYYLPCVGLGELVSGTSIELSVAVIYFHISFLCFPRLQFEEIRLSSAQWRSRIVRSED